MVRILLLSWVLALFPMFAHADHFEVTDCECVRAPCHCPLRFVRSQDDGDLPDYLYSCFGGHEVSAPRAKLGSRDICVYTGANCHKQSTTQRDDNDDLQDVPLACPVGSNNRCPSETDCANSQDIASSKFCDIQMGTANSQEQRDRDENCSDTRAPASGSPRTSGSPRVNPFCAQARSADSRAPVPVSDEQRQQQRPGRR